MLVKLLDRICCLTAALLFAQFPQFFLQYLHQLHGHVAELSYQVQQFELSAKLSGKTLSQLIFKFLQNSDPDIVRQGDLMRSIVERLVTMQNAQIALQEASLWSKPFHFVRHVQGSIAQDTWQKFQFGFSFSTESLVYACIGLIVGYSLFQMIKSTLLLLIPKKKTQAA